MTGTPVRHAGHRGADVAAGAASAVLVFAAVPAVLVALVGLPLPQHWARSDVVTLRALFDFLAILAWVAWSACCWSLLRSVVMRVRGRDVGTGGEARLPDWLAARIAAAVLAVTPVSFVVGTAAGASSHRPAAAQAAATQSGPAVARAASMPTGPGEAGTLLAASNPVTAPAPMTAPAPDVGVPATYTVEPGDSLWSIAERFYGDGADWVTIAQANLGNLMNDGSRFTDPSLIVTGWVLSLPGPAGDRQEAGSSDAPPPPGDPRPAGVPTAVATGQAGGNEAGAGAGAGVGTTEAAASVGTGDARSRAGGGSPDGAGDGPRGRAGGSRRNAGSGRRGTPSPPTVPLPELAALGIGTLVAAALARRARRSRQMASLSRDEGGLPPAVSELAADTASQLAPFDGAPVLDVLESANRHLTAALADVRGRIEVPEARLVRIGPDGIDVRVAGSVSWSPPGWQPRDHHTWHLPSGTDPALLEAEASGHDPWLPMLVPVGDNEDGTWLVPMGPGSCLPVLGSGAASMISAMRLAVESWSWSEDLVASEDATAVELAACGTRSARLAAGDVPSVNARLPVPGLRPLLYIGDPADLSPGARARCAVLTIQPAPATDLTVVVDDEAASIHPLGVTVCPQHLDGRRRRAVEELVATPGPVSDGEQPGGTRRATVDGTVGAPTRENGRRSGTTTSLRNGSSPAASPEDEDHLFPGQVEVRLLTAFPRIDGLIEDLPPKRSRRATELVAYLAMHHPGPVTSDRLRTRVLGSATADAAAKTLFNTVGAARRAMGRDEHGEPLLPPAAKSGRYCVSPLVTVDAVRSGALVAAAASTADDDEEMALLRAALDLVESEPMAGALTGYAWWSAEGHERRIAATLVDGACRLARLAVQHGHVDLGRWAIERARLVDPFSEVLSRAAMRLAADTGDADRLRREWSECQRRADELEPGSLPSEATERLYVELRRRMAAGSDGAFPARPEETAGPGDDR